MRGDLPGLYDVVSVLDRLGIDYRLDADEAWARCPAHLARTGRQDGSPSWSVNIETGLHHCFSCGYSGDLPRLVEQLMHLGPRKAIDWLSDPAMLATALERAIRPSSVWREPPPPHLDLSGFSLPPAAELKARRISLEAAVRYQILWDGRGFILPIHDRRHELIGYQIKRGAYVRNRPRGVLKGSTLFGLRAFEGPQAVLVESPLDAARMWSAGIDGAVAAFGAQVTDEQIDLIVSIAQCAVVALDDDNAGERAADRVETQLAWRIWPVRRFAYPKAYTGKDPGDLIDKHVLEGVAHARTRLERLAKP